MLERQVESVTQCVDITTRLFIFAIQEVVSTLLDVPVVSLPNCQRQWRIRSILYILLYYLFWVSLSGSNVTILASFPMVVQRSLVENSGPVRNKIMTVGTVQQMTPSDCFCSPGTKRTRVLCVLFQFVHPLVITVTLFDYLFANAPTPQFLTVKGRRS